MNSTDLIIIYLTVGAPFAVYYFLQNRRSENGILILKTSLVFLFWIFYAVVLLSRHLNAPRRDDKRLSFHQKQIELLLVESESDVSIFSYREVMERYIGLTLAGRGADNPDSAQEIYRVAETDNLRLGAICLRRRNRNKLARHQTEARNDFLRLIEKLSDLISDAPILQHSAGEIVKILQDDAAQNRLKKMFGNNLQTAELFSVAYSEKDLWKPQEHKPLSAETISSRLPTAAKTTN